MCSNSSPQLTPGSATERRTVLGAIAMLFGVLLLDQATKIWIEQNFSLGESLIVLPGCFSLSYVVNHGAAWGILSGYGWLLLGIGAIVMVLALSFLRTLTEGYRERYWAIFLVIGGVIGNSIDRLWRGAVVDFLDVFWQNHHWPTFNVADCAICIGVGIFMLSVLLRKPAAAPQASENHDTKPDTEKRSE